MKRYYRKLATLLAIFLAISTASSNAEPGYYPEGPQRNVSISTLLDSGWERCFVDPYGNDSILVTTAQEACSGNYLILAGRHMESDEILLLAAAPREDVWTVTLDQEVRYVNGSYWYFVPVESGDANSIGFSGTDNVYLYSCDYDDENHGVTEEESEFKLCWHLDSDGDLASAFFDGGYRIGSNTSLNNDSAYLREIYMIDSVMRDTLFAQDAHFNQMVAKCKRDFVREIQAQIAPTLARYESCLFTDVNKNNVSHVNAQILAEFKASVATGKAMNEAEIISGIQKLVLRAAILDRLVKSPSAVYINDLIEAGLTGLANVQSRYQAINSIRSQSEAVRGDFAALQSLIASFSKN